MNRDTSEQSLLNKVFLVQGEGLTRYHTGHAGIRPHSFTASADRELGEMLNLDGDLVVFGIDCAAEGAEWGRWT